EVRKNGTGRYDDSVRLRDCETARLRDCEAARLRGCEAARLRDCETARLRDCETASVRVCESASRRVGESAARGRDASRWASVRGRGRAPVLPIPLPYSSTPPLLAAGRARGCLPIVGVAWSVWSRRTMGYCSYSEDVSSTYLVYAVVSVAREVRSGTTRNWNKQRLQYSPREPSIPGL
ncbi:Protein of unknown function, partial [Gryllus bimaculatus]